MNSDDHSESDNSFGNMLARHGLDLVRGETNILQINVGRLCNLSCKHCHLEAGAGRSEVMSRATMDEVIACARRYSFSLIDVTGGAPEMNPDICYLLENIRPHAPKLMLRSNLVAINERNQNEFIRFLAEHGVAVTASFPSLSEAQAEAQRGSGVFRRSINVLQALNEFGYGRRESGLELNLVVNPSGAFLPTAQKEMEDRFKQTLKKQWDIVFNHLFAFANVPLGRFRQWLEASGNFSDYMDKLIAQFNPCSLPEVMCRSLLSVAWDGYLYDCDFNQPALLPLGGRHTHISQIAALPPEGSPIAYSDHCFACMAGSGFT